MNCTILSKDTSIDTKDIGCFDGFPAFITREFGTALVRSEEAFPKIPEKIGFDHETYQVTCFFGHVGHLWQGKTNVLLKRGTPFWEALERALGRKALCNIGIWDLSPDRKQFSICWKREPLF